MTYADVAVLMKNINEKENILLKVSIDNFVNKENLNTPITRGQFAILMDQLLDPFNAKDVNLKGEFKE